MTFRSRMLRGEADWSRVLELIRENYQVPHYRWYPAPGDMDYCRFIYEDDPDDIRNIRLWEDDRGRLVGFAWPDGELTDLVGSRSRQEVEEEILDWAENRLPAVHRTQAYDNDAVREEMLSRRGYRRTFPFTYYGKRDLALPVRRPAPPPGYSLRTLEGAGEREIVDRASLNRVAGGETCAIRYRRMMTRASTYRSDLDLVCVDGAGAVVGFCTAWFNAGSRTGLFEPYGCHPGHRRKGIARALLSEGLHRLRVLGATEVYVSHGGIDSEGFTDAALSLDAALGFSSVARQWTWERKSRKG